MVLDRFHVIKALKVAVDEVRKEQWRKADKEGRATLKGLRWLLYRHPLTRKDGNVQKLKALYMNGNHRIYRAWVLSNEFEQFRDFKDQEEAEDFLDNWCQTAMKSRLEPIKSFIKIVKNRASGFRTLDAFSDMTFLTVGDFDIPGQIPARFHTL